MLSYINKNKRLDSLRRHLDAMYRRPVNTQAKWLHNKANKNSDKFQKKRQKVCTRSCFKEL